MKAVAFRVEGTVQGVHFRKHCRAQAQTNRVKGWVQNASDGSVIGEAQGLVTAVDAFTFWLHTGSPKSVVEKVELCALEVKTGSAATFDIRR
jgi:acylphosphatase